jgi:DNA polymerase
MLIPEHVPMLNAKEQMHFTYDLMMNDRGLPLDMDAVEWAMPVLTDLENRVTRRVRQLTGGINPTQRDRMLEYFNELGLELENLQAKTLKDIITIKGEELDPQVLELLMLRLEGGKASTKKLKKMLALVCDDGRIRGGFLFYGAHTGRWSGKGIQPQNFTRGDYKPHQLEDLFWLLTNETADTFELLFERPIDAIAQGMRGFIKAPPGYKFVVSDFAAIEARMLAWLADEQYLLDLYHRNGDVYVKQASSLYNVDEQELLRRAKGDHPDAEAIKMRKFGKDIVLGCGFQMGGAGFYRNCIARGINVEEDFAHKAVKVYRADNKKIVKFWYDIEECSIKAVHEKRTVKNPVVLRHLQFFTDREWFVIRLPSGRWLRYRDPSVRKVERFGKMRPQLTFRTEVKGRWVRESTYGGKLTENVTQAVARDAMVESMVRSWNLGYTSIGTVHDELITEVPVEFGGAKELEHIMGRLPKWCKDAPISAEGWEGPRYRK